MKRWLCACWSKHYELIQAEMLSWKYTLLMSAIKWILVSSFSVFWSNFYLPCPTFYLICTDVLCLDYCTVNNKYFN